MSFATQAIMYGWTALASLGGLTNLTIYNAANTRHQVKAEDVIQVALGEHERCLSTQTATNPTYAVAPVDYVRTWTSNAYTTNGVTVYANIMTNCIGWHPDRDMLTAMDGTIKTLVPQFVGPNMPADGSADIAMLSVTGLFASLQIGDHTNQFTRTPCWTNFPGTTNATTNAATYGDYPWQIYVVDLQERYKVLYSCQTTCPPCTASQVLYYAGSGTGLTLADAKTAASANWHALTNGEQAVWGLSAYNINWWFSNWVVNAEQQSEMYVWVPDGWITNDTWDATNTVQTNVVVTGDGDPSPNGTYILIGGDWVSGVNVIHESSLTSILFYMHGGILVWSNSTLLGTYYPVSTNFTGNPVASYEYVHVNWVKHYTGGGGAWRVGSTSTWDGGGAYGTNFSTNVFYICERARSTYSFDAYANTNIYHKFDFKAYPTRLQRGVGLGLSEFSAQSVAMLYETNWYTAGSLAGYDSSPVFKQFFYPSDTIPPDEAADPPAGSASGFLSTTDKGFTAPVAKYLVRWWFNYCTNKFW